MKEWRMVAHGHVISVLPTCSVARSNYTGLTLLSGVLAAYLCSICLLSWRLTVTSSEEDNSLLFSILSLYSPIPVHFHLFLSPPTPLSYPQPLHQKKLLNTPGLFLKLCHRTGMRGQKHEWGLKWNKDELFSWPLLLPTGTNSSESSGESYETHGRRVFGLEIWCVHQLATIPYSSVVVYPL
jgi:hypothetical protein